MNSLSIVEVTHAKPQPRRSNPTLEAFARADRRWKEDPPKPSKRRLKKTWDFITDHVETKGLRVIDIGCGTAELSLRLHHAGAHVTAIDPSSIPLQNLPFPTRRAALPHTHITETYDLVLCTHVLGELAPAHYRLAISELAALTAPDGLCICSTDLDQTTEQPAEHFEHLFQTEFDIIDSQLLRRFFHTTNLSLVGVLRH